MKYSEKSFSVAVGSPEYRDNFDRIFTKKCAMCADPQADRKQCPSCTEWFCDRHMLTHGDCWRGP